MAAEKTYEVEEIINHRRIEKMLTQPRTVKAVGEEKLRSSRARYVFRVKWVNYRSKKNSWITFEDFKDEFLVSEYAQEHGLILLKADADGAQDVETNEIDTKSEDETDIEVDVVEVQVADEASVQADVGAVNAEAVVEHGEVEIESDENEDVDVESVEEEETDVEDEEAIITEQDDAYGGWLTEEEAAHMLSVHWHEQDVAHFLEMFEKVKEGTKNIKIMCRRLLMTCGDLSNDERRIREMAIYAKANEMLQISDHYVKYAKMVREGTRKSRVTMPTAIGFDCFIRAFNREIEQMNENCLAFRSRIDHFKIVLSLGLPLYIPS